MSRSIDEVLTDECEQRDWERAASRDLHRKIAAVNGWRDLNAHMPEPECFVLTWNGVRVGIDWWGSKRHRGDGVTHWCPFPKPPGAGQMYGLHSVKPTTPPARTPTILEAVLIAACVVAVWMVWP